MKLATAQNFSCDENVSTLLKYLNPTLPCPKGVSLLKKTCGAALSGGITIQISFINQVDDVNWPPQRVSETDFQASVLETLYSGQFTLSTQMTKPN